MSNGLPRVVLVTGVPGSGKSTLGRHIAEHLRVPFLARDDIRGGLLFSAGAWSDELRRVPSSDEAVEVFLTAVEGLLRCGVSCVIEYVIRRDRPADLERVVALSDCVVIITNCDDPMRRVVERNSVDPLIANRAVLNAVGASSVAQHTAELVKRMQQVEHDMMRDFALPILDVETTTTYQPSIDEIIGFATLQAADAD